MIRLIHRDMASVRILVMYQISIKTLQNEHHLLFLYTILRNQVDSSDILNNMGIECPRISPHKKSYFLFNMLKLIIERDCLFWDPIIPLTLPLVVAIIMVYWICFTSLYPKLKNCFTIIWLLNLTTDTKRTNLNKNQFNLFYLFFCCFSIIHLVCRTQNCFLKQKFNLLYNIYFDNNVWKWILLTTIKLISET